MGKEYKHSDGNNVMKEPVVEYIREEKIKINPLTEEDLKDTISSDEFWESTLQYVDGLFNKK